jgi:hypothetical protein
MTGVDFNIPEGKITNPDLHNYLVKNATIIGKPITHYVDEDVGVIYIKAYDLNDTGIIIKEDHFGRVHEGRIIGSSKEVKGLIKLLNLKDFVDNIYY